MGRGILLIEILLRSLLPPFYSFSQIEGICKQKLKKNPGNKDVLWFLSNHYINHKKYEESKPYIEALFEMEKDKRSVRFLLARVYYNLGNYGKVKEILQQNELLLPTDRENLYLGVSLIELKEFGSAIGYILNYLSQYKDNYEPYVKLGYAYYKQGLFDLALEAYKNAEKLNPQSSEIKESISLCYQKRGNQEHNV